jgi:hypothetical protein
MRASSVLVFAVALASIGSLGAARSVSAKPPGISTPKPQPQAAVEIKELNIKVVVKSDKVVPDNLEAAATLYRAATLEEMKLFEVTDRIAERAQKGLLPVGKATKQRVAQYVEETNELDESSRRRMYGHVLGGTTNDEGSDLNEDFEPLLARLVRTAGSPQPPQAKALHRQARRLAMNLSNRTYGAPVASAASLARQIELARLILSDARIRKAYGADSPWQVVERVSEKELGVAVNTSEYRSRAEAGATIIAWLGKLSAPLSTRGGADKVAEELARSKVPASARSLRRTPTPKHRPRAASKHYAKVSALCFDAKHNLVPCVVDEE